MTEYTTGSVRSKDGTTIGYRRLGHGPAIVIVHGGMQSSQYFMKLATALSDEFELFVVDRRGRGLSGPHGEYAAAREVEDLQAVIEASGASRIFGLSAGALASLRTALFTPSLTRVALYEPPLSVDGSAPVGWVPRYERELDKGKLAAALVTALRGIGTEPVMSRVPRFVLEPALRMGMKAQGAEGDDVSIPDLIPTQRYDMRLIAELADTTADYATIDADVLLLEGSRSPKFLHTALDALEKVLPHNRRVSFKGLSHSGPDDDGNPARVAIELRAFFR